MSSLIGKFVTTLLSPGKAMAQVKEEGPDASLVPSMIYIYVMALLAGLISFLMLMVFPPPAIEQIPGNWQWAFPIVVVPIITLALSFVGAGFLWGVVLFGLINGSMAQYKLTYRMIALLATFSIFSALLAPIPTVGPFLAFAVTVWTIIVMVKGIVTIFDKSPLRTWIVCVLIFGSLIVFNLILRVALEQQQFGGGPGAPNLQVPLDELGLDEDALREELEALGAGDEENN